MSAGSRTDRVRRRVASVGTLCVSAVAVTLTAVVWVPLVVVVDAVRLRWRFPMLRLGAFAVCWAWIEVAGVAASVSAWMRRRTHDQELHYRLMRWWCTALVRAIQRTCGMRVEVTGDEVVAGGGVVVLARHASLADALLSAWLVIGRHGVRPRYVLKRELLADPCLDIVGHRVPNHFLDREAADSSEELVAIAELGATVGPGSAAVIFPEGTRANPAKRRRALERIGERDPHRATRMAGLAHLLPPRPAGTLALLRGAPDADVVLVWHAGLDGLDSFGGILRALRRKPPVIRMSARRVPRAEVPIDDGAAADWLDAQWLALDREVDAALS